MSQVFLPPLTLQAGLDEDLRLFYAVAEATIHVGRPVRREITTEQGTIIKGASGRQNKVICKIGNPDPRDGISPITQGAWLEDIVRGMPEVLIPGTEIPDVVFRRRAAFEEIPRIEDLEELGLELSKQTLECIQASEDFDIISGRLVINLMS